MMSHGIARRYGVQDGSRAGGLLHPRLWEKAAMVHDGLSAAQRQCINQLSAAASDPETRKTTLKRVIALGA